MQRHTGDDRVTANDLRHSASQTWGGDTESEHGPTSGGSCGHGDQKGDDRRDSTQAYPGACCAVATWKRVAAAAGPPEFRLVHPPADGTGGFAHQATCRTGSAILRRVIWKFQTKRIDCVGRLSERASVGSRHHRRPSGAGIEGKHLTYRRPHKQNQIEAH